MLAQLDLDGLADRRAVGLSMGERRRLALARALVHQPANLVFDEPTNGLDVMSARTVRKDIRRLAESGRAMLGVQPCHAGGRHIVRSRDRDGARHVAASGTPQELLQQTGCVTLEDAFIRDHRLRRRVELMRAWWIARKEMREGLRDRRSLMSGLFYGIWGPW